MSSFDTPPSDEVLQENNDEIETLIDAAIPVVVEGSVRIDELPSKLGALRYVLLPSASRAIIIAPRDARRKTLSLNAFNKDVLISESEAACNSLSGYLLQSGFGIPHHFNFQDEVWAKPVNITTTGTDIVFADSDDAALVSVCIEQWAR